MSFGQAIASCYAKYATFSGRAPRSEYWFFGLFLFLVLTAGCMLFALLMATAGEDAAAPFLAIFLIGFLLAHVLPSLAVIVRRLHDTDKSGWFYFLGFIPLAGPIILLVFYCTPGTQGPNRYGDDPLGGQGYAAAAPYAPQPPPPRMDAYAARPAYTPPPPPPPTQPSGTGGSHDVTEQLARLAQLHASGALSDEEFRQAKSKLIG